MSAATARQFNNPTHVKYLTEVCHAASALLLANIERRETFAALLGMLCLLTCMPVNMTNMFNLFCIYRLHTLNMQLMLLEFGRQTMQRKRQQRRRSRRYNPYRRCRLSRPSAELWFETHLTNQEILFLSFTCEDISVAMVSNINFDFLEQKI